MVVPVHAQDAPAPVLEEDGEIDPNLLFALTFNSFHNDFCLRLGKYPFSEQKGF